MLLFLCVCKQPFQISRKRITQKVNCVYYYLSVKAKISIDFQIYISVPLIEPFTFGKSRFDIPTKESITPGALIGFEKITHDQFISEETAARSFSNS